MVRQPELHMTLSSKLHIPECGSDFLVRSRLMDHLNGTARLIMICAPAGFGKTTVASQWIRNGGQPAGWVSLDEQDNEPIRFWWYFTAALNEVQAGAGAGFSARIQAEQMFSIEKLMPILLQEISGIHSSFTLILDDYHVIAQPEIHDGIQYLLQHAPKVMQVMMISREEPPFSLHRLRLRKECIQIGMETLRFGEEDSNRFFNELHALNLSNQDIRVLNQKTEGWVAGMQLAVLTLREETDAASFIGQFTGNDKYIEEYLVEEVLKRLPESVHLFLLKTSILSRLTGSLCAAVSGESDAHEILRMLVKTNSFVIALDHRNEWFRYHHLFGDILYGLLHKRYPGRMDDWHRAASEWFAQHDMILEAIDHAIMGNDWSRATGMIVANAPKMLKRCEMVAMHKWRQKFKQDWLACHPELCIAFAWMHALSDETDQARALLRYAEQGVLNQDEEHRSDCLLELQVVRGYVEIVKKNVAEAIACFEQSIQCSHRFSQYFQIGIELNMDEAYVLRSRFGLNGYLNKVNVLFPRLREIWKNSGLPVLGYGSIVMAELSYERNDLEQVSYFVPRAIQLGTSTMNFGILVSAYFTLARWKKSQGRHSEMWLAVEEITELCRSYEASPHWLSLIKAFRVRLWIEENRRTEVEQWVERYRLYLGDKLASLHEYEWISLSRAFLYLNKNGEALKLLTRLQHEAEVKDRLGSRIECWILLSQAYDKRNRRKEMLDCIQTAVALAEPEGYVRIFLDEKVPLAEQFLMLLRHKRVSAKEREYISMLLEFNPPQGASSGQKSIVSSKLTEREAEVMEWIGAGLSNMEIARELHLSVGTVKGYVHQILSKLQVQSRTQAIAYIRGIHPQEVIRKSE